MTVASILLSAGVPMFASATAGEHRGVPDESPIAIDAILANPERYQGRQVVIRGTVLRSEHTVAPNGRPYFTLAVGTRQARLTVFSWTRPPAEKGDRVEVVGVFYPWRYNIQRVIVGQQISRLERAD